MADNLYGKKIAGPFAALCGGNTDNNGDADDCVTLADLEGGGFAIRDTKLGEDSPELRFTRDELMALGAKFSAA